jgi:hypothetical protein
MTEPTIKCPKCEHEIKLTETLTAPLIEAEKQRYKKYHERELAKVQADVEAREAAVIKQTQELARSQRKLEEQIQARLAQERKTIGEEEARKARLVLQNDLETQVNEITTLREALKEREDKLGEAQKAQAELIRKQRELHDAHREMDLTIEKRVEAALGDVRDKAKRDAEDALQLKVREKEHQISQMQTTIEELKKRSEQGSQQLQGEVFELELEDLL